MKGVTQVSGKNEIQLPVAETPQNTQNTPTKELNPQDVKVTEVAQKELSKIEEKTHKTTEPKPQIKRKREEGKVEEKTSVSTEKVSGKEEPKLKAVKKELVPLCPVKKEMVLKLFDEWCEKVYKTLSTFQKWTTYPALKKVFEIKIGYCNDWDHLRVTLNDGYKTIDNGKSQLSEAGQKLLPELEKQIKDFIDEHRPS